MADANLTPGQKLDDLLVTFSHFGIGVQATTPDHDTSIQDIKNEVHKLHDQTRQLDAHVESLILAQQAYDDHVDPPTADDNGSEAGADAYTPSQALVRLDHASKQEDENEDNTQYAGHPEDPLAASRADIFELLAQTVATLSKVAGARELVDKDEEPLGLLCIALLTAVIARLKAMYTGYEEADSGETDPEDTGAEQAELEQMDCEFAEMSGEGKEQ